MKRPRPPVFLPEVLPDPEWARELIERGAPYAPVQRYFRNQAEYGAVGSEPIAIVAPNFRGDFALGATRVPGAERLLHHEGFLRAAREMFDAAVVLPECVFANLTWQLPFPQGPGHTDVPAFVGLDRLHHPVWLLSAMGHSRLFEAERVDIVTAVAWFYRGRDGGFTWWPDGPDAPPRVHEGAIFNTAIVGDNDFMFHRVNPVGRPEDGLPEGLTLETRLVHEGGERWALRDGGRTIASLTYPELRISFSWKARVFRDAEAAARAEGPGLSLGEVVERFRSDLARRGRPYPTPSDPLGDPDFARVIASTYVATPPGARRSGRARPGAADDGPAPAAAS